MTPKTRRILVLEDDDGFRRLVIRMLEGAGLHVTSAGDFAAAMQVIESEEPIDLLLADVGMPTGTPHGLAVAKMAQLRRKRLKVIYMSGSYDVTKFAVFADGATVLQKPFTSAELIEAVEAALG